MIQTTSEGNLRKVKNIKVINKIRGSILEIFNYLFFATCTVLSDFWNCFQSQAISNFIVRIRNGTPLH